MGLLSKKQKQNTGRRDYDVEEDFFGEPVYSYGGWVIAEFQWCISPAAG
jgi:hypothetical protein